MRWCMLVLLPGLAFGQFVPSRTTRTHLTESHVETGFGTTTLALGDLNGNGADDLVVATPFPNFPSIMTASIEARDGATGEEIWRVIGFSVSGFGRHLGALEDLDGDGVRDFARVDLANTGVGPAAMRFETRSGATGQMISQSIPSATLLGGIGNPTPITQAEDLDGDGIGEVFIAGLIDTQSGSACAAILLNPVTGQILHQASVSINCGARSAARLDDLDGDGTDDLAVGLSMPEGSLLTPTGGVAFVSGANLQPIQGILGTALNQMFGASILRAPDLNGDGTDEILVGAPTFSPLAITFPAGSFHLLDGATRATILSVGSPSLVRDFAATLAIRTDFAGRPLLFASCLDVDPAASSDVTVGFEYRLEQLTFPPRRYVVDAAFETAGIPVALRVGDLNADQVDDLAVALPGTGLQQGSVAVFRSEAAVTYGPGTNPLTLATLSPNSALTSFLVSGGGPGDAILAVGRERASMPVAGGTVLVGLADAFFVPFSLNAGGFGTVGLLASPGPMLQGETFTVQAAQLDPGGALLLSNGLQVTP